MSANGQRSGVAISRGIPVIPGEIKRLRGDRPRRVVADASSVSVQQIYNIEKGKKNPSLDLLRRLCDFFGVNPADVCTAEGRAALASLAELTNAAPRPTA
jgi:transcriptional regulator with XRE-family HTH domain